MKKKSIFITGIVLALLVFAGCSEPALNLPKYVASADIKQNGVFLEGQPFDASKFSVTVIYTDGSKEELTGVNVQLKSVGTGGVSNGAEITAEAGTNSKGGVFTAHGAIVAYAIDSLTVTAPASITTAASGAGAEVKEAKASDFTVVANYRDSQGAAQTLALVADADYSVEVKLNQALSADKPNGTARADVTLEFGPDKKPAGYQVTGINVTYSENVTPGDYSEYEWSGKVVYAQVPASSTVKYFNNGVFDGDKMVEVYKVYTPAGESTSFAKYYLEKIDSGLKFTLTSPLEGDGNENRFAASGDTAAFTMTYTYVKDEDAAYGYKTTEPNTDIVIGSIDGVEENADGKLVSTNEGSTWYDTAASGAMEITGIKDDYITALKAERRVDMPFIVGADPQPGDFVVTATYASGYVNASKNVLEAAAYTVETKDVTTSTTSVDIKLKAESPYSDAATKTTAAIKVVADYPSSVSVTKIPTDVKTNTAYSAAKWEYKIVWSSGKTYDAQTAGNTAADMPRITYTFDPAVAGEAGTSEDITITWTCNTVSGEIKTACTPIA